MPTNSSALPAREQAQSHKLQGNEAYAQKDFERALVHYHSAIELDPKEPSYHANCAAVYAEQKKWPVCVTYCDAALRLAAKSDKTFLAKLYKRKGKALEKSNRPHEAMRAFRLSLDNVEDREVSETLIQLKQTRDRAETRMQSLQKDADACTVKRNFEQALLHYNKLLELDRVVPYSQRASVLLMMSMCHAELHRFEDSMKFARMSVEADGKNPQAHIALAYALRDLERPREACVAMLGAYDLDPSSLLVFDNLLTMFGLLLDIERDKTFPVPEHPSLKLRPGQIAEMSADPEVIAFFEASKKETNFFALLEKMRGRTTLGKIVKFYFLGLIYKLKNPVQDLHAGDNNDDAAETHFSWWGMKGVAASHEPGSSVLPPAPPPTNTVVDRAPIAVGPVETAAEQPKPAAVGLKTKHFERKVSWEDRPPKANPQNGGTTQHYTWTQTVRDLQMKVKVPKGTRTRQVVCVIKPLFFSLSLKADERDLATKEILFEGELYEAVRPDSSAWVMQDNDDEHVYVSFDKLYESYWATVIEGHPIVDTTDCQLTETLIKDMDSDSQQRTIEMVSKPLDDSPMPTEEEMAESLLEKYPEYRERYEKEKAERAAAVAIQ